MAELIIRCPGEPDRTVPLKDAAIVVGRGADCDIQISDKRSSRRHLKIAPFGMAGAGNRTWVATDLQSANGTFVGEDRIQRRGLDAGDVMRIGETTFEIRDAEASKPAAASASIVSGSLLIQSVTAGEPAAAARAAPVPVAVAAPVPVPVAHAHAAAEAKPAAAGTNGAGAAEAPDRAAAGARSRTRGDSRAFVKAAAFLVVGLLAIVGVEVLLGEKEASLKSESTEARDYTDLLADADLPFPTLEGNFATFEATHPSSVYLPTLRRFVDARRAIYAQEQKGEDALEALQHTFAMLPPSMVRGNLLDLQRQYPGSSRLKSRIDRVIADLDRLRDSGTTRERAALETELARLLSQNDPAAALRRISAFRFGHPVIAQAEREQLAARDAEARDLAKSLADKALAASAAASDPDAKRAPLVLVLPGIAGTADEERVVAVLRASGPGSVPAGAALPRTGGATGGSAGGGTPAGEPTVALSPALLAKAGEAEASARGRHFDKAAEAYDRLIASATLPPRLKREWEERAGELNRILSLVTDLTGAIAAAGAKPLRPHLAEGVVDLLAADAEGIKVRKKDAEESHPWSELAPADVLLLLTRPRPTPDQRLALAIVAVEIGERKACVEELISLLDVPTHKDLAFQVAARRLDGRTSVPEGGYLVLNGELLAKAEYDRRIEANVIAGLRVEANGILEKVQAEPGFRKLAQLKEKRDELDKRRAYALLAIFNEKHYPYPYKDPAIYPFYEIVQAEIDRRIEAVYEVWKDPLTVHVLGKGSVTRETPVGKLLERHEAICRELESKGKDAADLRNALAPLAMYVTDEPLTVRNYFRDADEKTLFSYNKWVLETYNPARTGWVSAPEREQIQITNDYRMVMGYTMNVAPGPAPLDQVTDKTVVKILDEAKETGRTALHAVRIDDRLVKAARGHSIDMDRHGYFDHFAPAGAGQSDDPGSSPFDRMAKCGYSGGGASENIAGAGSPLDAHMRWRHSSGHHRNILSGWYDMGCGQSGNLWTQNFGAGGIPEIGSEPPPEPPPFAPLPPIGPPGKPPKKK